MLIIAIPVALVFITAIYFLIKNRKNKTTEDTGNGNSSGSNTDEITTL